MARISDMAHDKENRAVTNPFEVPQSVPEWPSDDYVASNKAFWRLCLAKAQHAPESDKWTEERFGREGIVFGLKKTPLVKELWPKITPGPLNSFLSSNLQYLYGNMEMLDRGYGEAKSLWWIALTWEYDREKGLEAFKARYRRAKPSKKVTDPVESKKLAKPVVEVAGLEIVDNSVLHLPEDSRAVVKVPEVPVVPMEFNNPAAILHSVADQLSRIQGREQALDERKKELMAYLDDMRKVVEGL